MVLAGVDLPAQAFDCKSPHESHKANANALANEEVRLFI
jgi:hypothetical protein